jgi:predicted DCC family thiol-disulfide oxidoreductase YuxK
MLKNNIIIYDHECPMCQVYTGAFIKFELLDEHGRQKYSELDNLSCNVLIDKDRAKNEIALIDIDRQEVRYGLESLFYILSHHFPALNLLFHQQWFVFVLKKLYKFISYNRKVIAPSSKQSNNSCIPDFDLKYRVLYILLMMGVVAYFSIYFQVFMAFWLYWICQVFLSLKMNKIINFFAQREDKKIHEDLESKVKTSISYLGHHITILLIGFLLLIPSVFYPQLLLYNMAVVSLVFIKEFWRRIINCLFLFSITSVQNDK